MNFRGGDDEMNFRARDGEITVAELFTRPLR